MDQVCFLIIMVLVVLVFAEYEMAAFIKKYSVTTCYY